MMIKRSRSRYTAQLCIEITPRMRDVIDEEMVKLGYPSKAMFVRLAIQKGIRAMKEYEGMEEM